MSDKPDVEKWTHAAAMRAYCSEAMVRLVVVPFLRAAAADGYTLVRVPDALVCDDPDEEELQYQHGHNDCLAAALASAVEVGE